MSIKKILFVSPTGTLDNGAEISIFYLMTFLKSKGYEIYNVVPQAHSNKQVEYFERYEEQGISTHFIPILKWWWEDAPGGSPGLSKERAFFYRENINEIRKLVQENDIDLIVTNTVNMFQGAMAAAAESIPHYWLIHEFPTGEFGYYRNRIDFLEEYSEKLFCVTGELHSYLEPLISKAIGTFAPYTKIKKHTVKSAEKKRFVSVGRLTERKNQLELIKAFEMIELDGVELVFIGAWDNSYKKKCMAYIQSHHIKNVQFCGGLEDPWTEITNKDICILPSKLETFGLVYAEAILNGIPTILSNNPGHLSAYEIFHFGNLYKSGDPKDLSKKMEQLFQNFEKKKEESLSFVPKANSYYQVETVYKEIIDSISKESGNQLRAIRHVADLYSTNENKSRLAKAEQRVRKLYFKVRNRIDNN